MHLSVSIPSQTHPLIKDVDTIQNGQKMSPSKTSERHLPLSRLLILIMLVIQQVALLQNVLGLVNASGFVEV